MLQIAKKIFNKAFPKDTFFDSILTVTLSFEGGYTERDEPTYKGITQRLYTAYAKKHNLPDKKVKDLTDDEVWSVYYNEFYMDSKIFSLPQEIRGVVFDFAVNSGSGTATEGMQKVLGTKVDKIIGNQTRDKAEQYLRNFGINSFIANYHKRRKEVMVKAIAENPSKKENWNGWMERLDRLKEIYKE